MLHNRDIQSLAVALKVSQVAGLMMPHKVKCYFTMSPIAVLLNYKVDFFNYDLINIKNMLSTM